MRSNGFLLKKQLLTGVQFVVPGAGFEPAASGPMALQIMSFVP